MLTKDEIHEIAESIAHEWRHSYGDPVVNAIEAGMHAALAKQIADLRRQLAAAQELCEIYFGLACIGSSEDKVRAKRDILIDMRLRAKDQPWT